MAWGQSTMPESSFFGICPGNWVGAKDRWLLYAVGDWLFPLWRGGEVPLAATAQGQT